ncbi:MAG: hypothetical protein ACJAY8_000352 [Sphingobacteriales bacterium]|jgi:hypothetical protein
MPEINSFFCRADEFFVHTFLGKNRFVSGKSLPVLHRNKLEILTMFDFKAVEEIRLGSSTVLVSACFGLSMYCLILLKRGVGSGCGVLYIGLNVIFGGCTRHILLF